MSLSLVVNFNSNKWRRFLPSHSHVILLSIVTGLGLCIAGTVMESHPRLVQWFDNGMGSGLVPSGSGFLVSNTTYEFSIDSKSLISTLKQFAINKGLDKEAPSDIFGREQLAQMLQLNSPSTHGNNKTSFSGPVTSLKNSDGRIVLAGGVAFCTIGGAFICVTFCK